MTSFGGVKRREDIIVWANKVNQHKSSYYEVKRGNLLNRVYTVYIYIPVI